MRQAGIRCAGGRRARLGFLAGALALALTACAPGGAAPAGAPAPAAAPTRAASASGAPASAPASSLSAAASAAPPAAPAPVALPYGIPVRGSQFLHLVAGQKKGFFEREGIEAEIIITQNVPLIAQSLEGGSIRVGTLGPDVGIAAIEKGSEIVYVAGVQDKSAWSLIAQPELRGYADLRGKVLGVATIRGGSTTVLKRMLQLNGLREGDYDLVQAGGTSGRIAALQSKAIAAGLIAAPFNVTISRLGYSVLGQVSDAFPHYPEGSLAVVRSWARANEDVLLRVLRAHIASIDWVYDPANREEAIALLAEDTNVPEDVAREVYDASVQLQAWSPKGRIDLEGFRTMIELLAEDGVLTAPLPDPQKYLDTSYLQKLGIR